MGDGLMDFTGKNYIITGAGGSIGRAVVELVVQGGGTVYALDLDEEALRSLSRSLNSERYHQKAPDRDKRGPQKRASFLVCLGCCLYQVSSVGPG